MTFTEATEWCADHSVSVSFERALNVAHGRFTLRLPTGESWVNTYHPASFSSMFPYSVECFAEHLKVGSCKAVIHKYAARAV